MESETRCCVECTIVTTTDVLSGQLYYNQRFRFSDVIGWPDSPVLMLHECMADPIDWIQPAIVSPRRVLLNRDQLVFAIPLNEPKGATVQADEYFKKQPRRVELNAAGWTITGEIYVAEGVLPDEVLSRGLREFFPITSAVAVDRGIRQLEFRSDVMILNRRQVSVFWLDV
jgi:hypothetical protein